MRTILHSDCNNFFASVECAFDPSLKGKPLAVCGSQELRHGIVLAKNEQAKRFGVKTAEAIWEAQRKCPELVIVEPHFERYSEYSKKMRAIYCELTDRVEPFGLDECWLDMTGCPNGGVETAALLRKRAIEELGITVSVGVSFNKVFAKLGSDMHKPNATTVITPENFREKIWPLPASDLLFVGRATLRALKSYGLNTIGDVARTDKDMLRKILGKGGETLSQYANGLDDSPVLPYGYSQAPQSVGNSTTLPRDLSTYEDARIVLLSLAEEVCSRLRAGGYAAGTATLFVRDSTLRSFERQTRLRAPSNLATDFLQATYALLLKSYSFQKPIRSLGVRATHLCSASEEANEQSLLAPCNQRAKNLEKTVDALRDKYGDGILRRGLLLSDPTLSNASPSTNILPQECPQ